MRKRIRRLSLIALAPISLAAFCLAGCSVPVETDQARLCRMALPALMPDGTRITILAQRADRDAHGLEVEFRAEDEGPGAAPLAATSHVAACRFRLPGRPRESRDLVSIAVDGEPLAEARLFFLIRDWLGTPEGRNADPAPLGDIGATPEVPRSVAYGLQMALDGLPRAAIYGLLAAAYSLIYGLIGRINFAFGELAAAGGYAAAMTALAFVGAPPGPLLAAAFVLAGVVAAGWSYATARCVFVPLRHAHGQQALVATIGLALFLQELLRIAQGDRTSWMPPLLNQPFAVVHAADFYTVASPMAFVATALTLGVSAALVFIFHRTRIGREWRAYADDSLAAELLGVDPVAVATRAFLLSGALAGLAGAIMTATFGAVGYGLSGALTLKALAAAIVGGFGSLPGAFLGGLAIGAVEAGWSAFFPINDRDLAVYALLVIFIALRPSGILGVRENRAHNLFPRRP
jgi:branched-chain amino acid transport system permease protein